MFIELRQEATQRGISDPTIDPHQGRTPPAMMADYLKRAGINVELATPALHGREVDEVLAEASSGEDGLLVMGAYGHWRWREYVPGGATHTSCATLRCPY
jgi:nucleotide-binding universal stress UspA family protein